VESNYGTTNILLSPLESQVVLFFLTVHSEKMLRGFQQVEMLNGSHYWITAAMVFPRQQFMELWLGLMAMK
jgi:hypothetical protein